MVDLKTVTCMPIPCVLLTMRTSEKKSKEKNPEVRNWYASDLVYGPSAQKSARKRRRDVEVELTLGRFLYESGSSFCGCIGSLLVFLLRHLVFLPPPCLK